MWLAPITPRVLLHILWEDMKQVFKRKPCPHCGNKK